MRLLSINTSSTAHFSLAITQDTHILVNKNERSKRVLSSTIIQDIKQSLKKAKLTLQDIDGFAIGLGPGSFTSLRVGLSTVKALSFATQKNMVGIPSLDTLALNTKKNGKVCVICDARRNLFYSCIYEKKGNELKRLSEYLLISLEDILKKIKGEVTFVGDGIKIGKKAIEAKKNLYPHFEAEKNWYPRAENVALLALQKFHHGKIDDIYKLVPLYLYPEDCQVQK